MKKVIDIGVKIDLEKLIESRMLIQGNSGSGKSGAIRKLIEEVSGKVPVIVLDIEGEFATLREKHDFILFGKDGDFPIHIKYADKLCEMICENNVSAVIDLYELKMHERILFVRRFLEKLINLPKKYWTSKLCVIDEAHLFCPEKGKAESADAVIDICTRGRKRGICAVLATQRLSKLNKDAAAELKNKLIGNTGLDIDMKRASDEIGFNSKDEYNSLRQLSTREFYAFGPAISNQVEKVFIKDCATSFPTRGGLSEVPKPSTKVLKEFDKFKDLPQEAEKELTTLADYKKELGNAKREITKLKNLPAAREITDEMIVSHPKFLQLEAELKSHYNLKVPQLKKDFQKQITEVFNEVSKQINLSRDELLSFSNDSFELFKEGPQKEKWKESTQGKTIERISINDNKKSFNPPAIPNIDSEKKLGRCARAILQFVASYPDRVFSKVQIGVATNYSPNSGGFNNALSELGDLIQRDSGRIRVNLDSDYPAVLGNYTVQDYNARTFLNKLGKCAREIYTVLLDNPDIEYSKEELGELTNYSANSGGFNNSLSTLNTLELIDRNNGIIKLNPELKELL